MASDRFTPDGVSPDVSSNVSPLRQTSTDRVRKHRERLRAEKDGQAERGPGGHWAPGNATSRTAALMHGAYTPQLVEELAADIRAGLLARPSCPRRLVEDPDDENLEAWSTAVAICRLLRSALTTGNIQDAMTEQLAEDETMTHASTLNAGSRQLRGSRKPSILDQLHRYQTQAMHLSKTLGLDAASRRMAGEDQPANIDYAKYWAARAEQKAREAEGGAG